jgi:DNA-binding NtrC family response regulator
MSRGSLLLVDDDRHVLDSMADWLREQDFEVDEALDQASALERLSQRAYDLVLCDVRLPDGDGFQILDHCHAKRPGQLVILLTGYATVETGVEAVRAGAFDLLTKPLIDQELLIAIDRALSQRLVLEENRTLKAQLDQKFGMENIVGRNERMQRVFEMIDSIADTRASVLVTGESGTGKSLIARAIHRRSGRRDKPFVEVACGALPENLLESELFGHITGSFTGATTDKIGKFTQAHGGTIFLDEIGTASLGMQVKMLRVLQEFEFEPVGSTKTQHVDVRVILATNEDLSKAVAEGRFRQDLFYRVNVINLEIPSLRDRLSDIPMLASHFLKRVSEEAGKPVEGFTPDAIAVLQRHSWPGNVRELQNVIERAVLLGKGSYVSVEDLPSHLAAHAPASVPAKQGRLTLKEALEGPERQIILQTLKEFQWNRNVTADALGINRTTLYKKMKRLGLEEMEASMARA